MDFTTGNSGNTVQEAVIKRGIECRQEGAYCQLLGPKVCPEIYGLLPDGYVMERLKPAKRYPSLIRDMQDVLEIEVWSRPALPSSSNSNWQENLLKYGVVTPHWVASESYCMVHGDCTTSNALRRGKDLIICDPRPPRDYIPQCRETDLGRLLQSTMNWEVVAYGAESVNFLGPHFRNSLELSRALFWCGAAAARIEYLERSRANRKHILDWCEKVRSRCHV